MYYNEILRELREDRKMTQTELAKVFNCNQITISQYERGTRALSIEMLVKYADFFNVTTDYILCRDKKRGSKNQININENYGKITMKWGDILGLFKYLMGEEPGIFEKAAFIIKSGGDNGAYGEYLTRYLFNSARMNGYLKVLSNIYLQYKDDTTEIDILVIHERGFFVIESKNYSGWIFGSENQYQWTQAINKITKNKFYNPIKQNRTHIKVLSNYLNVNKDYFKSYIVFSERCELKKVPEDTKEYTITKRDKLIDIIKKDIQDKNVIYSRDEVNSFESKLKPLTEVSKETKEKHIKNIKDKY